MKRFATLLSVLVLILSGCGGGGDNSPPVPVESENTGPAVTQLDILNAPFNLSLEEKEQLYLLLIYSDGTSQERSGSAAQWTSENPGVAQVVAQEDGSIWLVGKSAGTTRITATRNGVSGQADVEVNNVPAPTLTEVVIEPADSARVVGGEVDFKAYGKYDDGSEKTLSGCTFTSSIPEVAAFQSPDNAATATALQFGETIVTASCPDAAPVTTTLSVHDDITAFYLDPPSLTVPRGFVKKLCAMVERSDGTTERVCNESDWSFEDPNTEVLRFLEPNNEGYFETINPGTAIIVAEFQGHSDSGDINVTAANATGLEVTPVPAFVEVGGELQLTATCNFDDDSFENVTRLATWSSSDTTTATITRGKIRGVSSGTALIKVDWTWLGTPFTSSIEVEVQEPSIQP